jgi:hypothetical protein
MINSQNVYIQRLLYIPGMAITGILTGVVGGLAVVMEDMDIGMDEEVIVGMAVVVAIHGVVVEEAVEVL